MLNLLSQKPASKDSLKIPFWTKLKIHLRSAVVKSSTSLGLAESDNIDGQSRSFRMWMLSSFGALICILLIGVINRHHNSGTTDLSQQKTSQLLDIIPDGYVLVPIDPINLESIDAVLGDYGWADIYRDASSTDQSLQDDFGTRFRTQHQRSTQRSKNKLASGVAIIRAPHNRERIAAIIDETNGELISALARPVHLALRRKPTISTAVSQENSRKLAAGYQQKRFFNIELIEENGIDQSRMQEN